MYTITAPLSVYKTKLKKFYFNLNQYRNAHYHTLNTAKKNYKDILTPQIKLLPKFEEIQIRYTLYPKTKRLCDISNILSIHDKFFCDALVELGKLPDDDYRYLKHIRYDFGEVDTDNPRVVITIQEIS